ncbi:MAG TPA: hypothetical protein VFV50_00950, partial [Bdellovibrionales bacterium]|nr:hypothetical protein [Bdellovibrionales bacterium]
RIKEDYLDDEKALVIGTGGFSRLFEKEKVFDALLPDLILVGLLQALKMNSVGATHENNDVEIKNSSGNRYRRELEL